jgi:3-oxoacyl-[acyl-carrier protein] reductase
MVEAGWGRIVYFAGMNAIQGYTGRAHVSASKHGGWGLTKALAKEFAAQGITANCISPGPIGTDRADPEMAAHIAGQVGRIPTGRLGAADEVAAAVSLLASDKGAFINGQMIQVNGGTQT